MGIYYFVGEGSTPELLFFVRLSHRAIDEVPGRVDESVSRLLFQGLIHRSWHGEVAFLIPDTLADIRKLAQA